MIFIGGGSPRGSFGHHVLRGIGRRPDVCRPACRFRVKCEGPAGAGLWVDLGLLLL